MEESFRIINRRARITGVLYLFIVFSGIFGLIYLPSRFNLNEDPLTISASILSQEMLFRAGILNGVASSVVWVFMVLGLYRLFRATDEHAARVLVALVLVQIPVALSGEVLSLVALKLMKGEMQQSFSEVQQLGLAKVFLNTGNYGVAVLETYWGMWLFPLAVLVYKSGFLPRLIGIWLFINGLAYVALSFTGLMWPQYAGTVYKLGMPAFFGELVFVLWLLIFGARKGTLHLLKNKN